MKLYPVKETTSRRGDQSQAAGSQGPRRNDRLFVRKGQTRPITSLSPRLTIPPNHPQSQLI